MLAILNMVLSLLTGFDSHLGRYIPPPPLPADWGVVGRPITLTTVPPSFPGGFHTVTRA
jgi:hypothetical protein